MEIIFNLDEIDSVAKQFVSLIKNYKIITFTGELGAGKTTLISAICKALGVAEAITSPTYALIQEHHFGNANIIFHIDLYRITSNREAMEAGIEECVISGELCFVEWPEKSILLMPEERINVTIEVIQNNKRKLIVQLPQ